MPKISKAERQEIKHNTIIQWLAFLTIKTHYLNKKLSELGLDTNTLSNEEKEIILQEHKEELKPKIEQGIQDICKEMGWPLTPKEIPA